MSRCRGKPAFNMEQITIFSEVICDDLVSKTVVISLDT